MLLAYPLPVLSAAVLPSHKALAASVDSPPRENTTTVGAHRGAVLCYRAAAGFAVRAGPSSPSPPRRHAVPLIAAEGSISKHPRNGREGRRVLAVGTIFAITAATSRRLSGSARGLDFDRPPERPRGTAHPRRRPRRLRHHHRCDAGRPSARAVRGASLRSAASIHALLASAPLRVVPCFGRNGRSLLHISSMLASYMRVKQ